MTKLLHMNQNNQVNILKYLFEKRDIKIFLCYNMADLNLILENPNWAKLRKYAMGGPNGGDAYARWPQGSIGMNSPMPLWSNEYGHLYMKHGQNDLLSYSGGIKDFAPSVDGNLQNQIHQCGNMTMNPAGCQQVAISKVYSTDAHNNTYHKKNLSRQTQITPHPFNVSYHLGYPQQQYPQLPPWGPQN